MRGAILAGGNGTRLTLFSSVTGRSLLPGCAVPDGDGIGPASFDSPFKPFRTARQPALDPVQLKEAS